MIVVVEGNFTNLNRHSLLAIAHIKLQCFISSLFSLRAFIFEKYEEIKVSLSVNLSKTLVPFSYATSQPYHKPIHAMSASTHAQLMFLN